MDISRILCNKIRRYLWIWTPTRLATVVWVATALPITSTPKSTPLIEIVVVIYLGRWCCNLISLFGSTGTTTTRCHLETTILMKKIWHSTCCSVFVAVDKLSVPRKIYPSIYDTLCFQGHPIEFCFFFIPLLFERRWTNFVFSSFYLLCSIFLLVLLCLFEGP